MLFNLTLKEPAPGGHARHRVPPASQILYKEVWVSVLRIRMPLEGMLGTKNRDRRRFHGHRDMFWTRVVARENRSLSKHGSHGTDRDLEFRANRVSQSLAQGRVL